MRVGSVLGPYRGNFWIDLEVGRIVVKPADTGITSELSLSVTPEQTAALLETMLPEPVPTQRGGAAVCAQADCGKTFTWSYRSAGATPTMCRRCRRRLGMRELRKLEVA